MAERPATLTQPLTRAQLTEFVGTNPRALRVFEAFFRDLSQTLPDAAMANSAAAEAAQIAANAARIVADEALELAEAQELAQQLVGQVSELRDRLSELSRRLDTLMASQDYATQLDQDAITPTVAYFGRAVPGSLTSAAVWQIKKLDFGVDGDVAVTWADGDADFNNVWDNRASLSYS